MAPPTLRCARGGPLGKDQQPLSLPSQGNGETTGSSVADTHLGGDVEVYTGYSLYDVWHMTLQRTLAEVTYSRELSTAGEKRNLGTLSPLFISPVHIMHESQT